MTQPAGSTTNSEPNQLPDGAPAELSTLCLQKAHTNGHCISSPSTLMADDPATINECPAEAQREGEHAIAVPKTVKPEDLHPCKKHGLSDEWWDETKRAMCEEYGELMASDLKLPRVLVTHEIFSYDFLHRGQKQCIEMAENDALDAEDRLKALESLGYLADIATRKSKQLLDLGEKANKKTVEHRKRNLPPSTLVQVNVAGGQTPQSRPVSTLGTPRNEPRQVTAEDETST